MHNWLRSATPRFRLAAPCHNDEWPGWRRHRCATNPAGITELTSLPKLSRSRQILLDFFLVFLFTAVLIRPYFKAKYTDKWASIDSTFIGDARFLSDHWPHPQWQPLWYAGTRFDYIYPP